ncbi:hypothetical protein MYX82_12520, partial [Acidobacteria bacterium AH-259-D05]|nr:hypothetical protein [Acidobacteria bacterium AH-259-D05]
MGRSVRRKLFRGRKVKILVTGILAVAVSPAAVNAALLGQEEPTVARLIEQLRAIDSRTRVAAADAVTRIQSLEMALLWPLAEALSILVHSVQAIDANKIEEHYEEIQRHIVQVGPKVASFYLRDVVSLFQLEDKVTKNFQFVLQPIDVWVRKIAFKTGVLPQGATDDQLRHAIVRICEEQDCSPIQFNQGAWYAGYFAF